MKDSVARRAKEQEAENLEVHGKEGLVEVAGVEPASETDTSKENYMLISFMLPAFTGNVRCRALRTNKKRWQLAR